MLNATAVKAVSLVCWMSALLITNVEILNSPSQHSYILIKNLESSCLKGRTPVWLFASFPLWKASLSTRGWAAKFEKIKIKNKNCLPKSKSSNAMAYKLLGSLFVQPSSDYSFYVTCMANTEQNTEDKEPGPGTTIKRLCPFAASTYQFHLCLANFFHMQLSIIQAAFRKWGKKKKPSVVIETIAICVTFVWVDRRLPAAVWPVSKDPGWETGGLKGSPWISDKQTDTLPLGCHTFAWEKVN